MISLALGAWETRFRSKTEPGRTSLPAPTGSPATTFALSPGPKVAVTGTSNSDSQAREIIAKSLEDNIADLRLFRRDTCAYEAFEKCVAFRWVMGRIWADSIQKIDPRSWETIRMNREAKIDQIVLSNPDNFCIPCCWQAVWGSDKLPVFFVAPLRHQFYVDDSEWQLVWPISESTII